MRKWLFLSFVLLIHFSTNAQQPNIVIIVSDDHAYQTISAYGSKFMQTPNIDRIAKEGVRFNKAYVTNSICGPSRAVILTGKYSHKNGFKDNISANFNGAQNSCTRLCNIIRDNGAKFGIDHFGRPFGSMSYLQEAGDLS